MRISDLSSDVCSSDLDNRTGGHESNQLTEEAALAVLSVETFGFSLGQLLHFRSYNAQASVFEAGNDLADHVFSNGVRLDDGKHTLNSHRTEGRRVGKECVRTGRSRGSRDT